MGAGHPIGGISYFYAPFVSVADSVSTLLFDMRLR